MKKSRRNWSIQVDKMLSQIMLPANGSRKLKWEDVAEILHDKVLNCQKTGKQCRQRWHNHLAPQLNNSGEWTREQNDILFRHHGEMGNKWAKIATFLKGRTDNCVKNHFYSTLRRGMRKVNNFIHEHRKKKHSVKQFKPDVLTKILIIADGDPEQKLNAKNNADSLSKKIKSLLIEVSLEEAQNTYNQFILDQIIQLIMQFNKNCKKRKGKKKGPLTERLAIADKAEEDQIQQEDISGQDEFSEKDISVDVKHTFVEKISKIPQSKQLNKKIGVTRVRKQQKKEDIEQKSKQTTKTAIITDPNQINTNNNHNKINSKNLLPYPKLGENQNQIDSQQKDEVKSVEFQAVPLRIENQVNTNAFCQRKRLLRAGSIQSLQSELNNNFATTSFYNPANYNSNNNDDNNVERIFHSSAFQLPQPQQNQNLQQMFADSHADGIKKGSAFFHLSARSIADEKGSFFNLIGDRGSIEPSQLIQSGGLAFDTSKSSAIEGLKFKRDNQSPGISFINGNSAFRQSEHFKGFLSATDPKEPPKLIKQDNFHGR